MPLSRLPTIRHVCNSSVGLFNAENEKVLKVKGGNTYAKLVGDFYPVNATIRACRCCPQNLEQLIGLGGLPFGVVKSWTMATDPFDSTLIRSEFVAGYVRYLLNISFETSLTDVYCHIPSRPLCSSRYRPHSCPSLQAPGF